MLIDKRRHKIRKDILEDGSSKAITEFFICSFGLIEARIVKVKSMGEVLG